MQNRKCPLCGYAVSYGGACEHVCRYDRRTGAVNAGPRVHVGCAEAHRWAHWDTRNPHSLASMSKQERPV